MARVPDGRTGDYSKAISNSRGKPLRRPLSLLAVLLLAGCAAVSPRTSDPVIPPRLDQGVVLANDGYRLPLSVWLPAARDPAAVLLALHGFNDYRRSFAGLGEYLSKQGVAVYAYDQRGFGATLRPGHWAGTASLARDFGEVAALLRRRYPDTPLYALGDSMGAAVVMISLARHPEFPVKGAVLVAPALWGGRSLNPLYRAVLWLAAHTVPGLRVTGRGLKRVVTDNEAMLRAMRADPLVLKDARIDALYGIVELMDEAVADASLVRTPLLVLYGERDQIIPKGAVCRVLGDLTALHRELFYRKGYHLLLRDREAHLVWQDIAAWLRGESPGNGEPPDCGHGRMVRSRPSQGEAPS
jgi:acylglycerol lipase